MSKKATLIPFDTISDIDYNGRTIFSIDNKFLDKECLIGDMTFDKSCVLDKQELSNVLRHQLRVGVIGVEYITDTINNAVKHKDVKELPKYESAKVFADQIITMLEFIKQYDLEI